MSIAFSISSVIGFMCAWTHTMIVAGSANSVISHTASLYIMQAFGVDCHETIALLISVFLIGG